MNMAIEKKTITFSVPSVYEHGGFDNPASAILYGKYINKKLRSELPFDLDQFIGRNVRQFHWNDLCLALEFAEDEFLVLRMIDDSLRILPEKTLFFIRKHNVVYEIKTKYHSFLWEPRNIANKYTGKCLVNIHFAEQEIYLYFQNMPFLIHCSINYFENTNEKFLLWTESE